MPRKRKRVQAEVQAALDGRKQPRAIRDVEGLPEDPGTGVQPSEDVSAVTLVTSLRVSTGIQVRPSQVSVGVNSVPPANSYDHKAYGRLAPYRVPHFAQSLLVKPKSRVKLSMTPTPIHPWKLPGVPPGFEVSVKREDLIGSTLTGNKIRKLEFLFADAIEQGCDSVVTFGGFSSNHSRATVMAARELGLQAHVLVLSPTPEVKLNCRGNLLLSRLAGAKMVVFPARTDATRAQQVREIHERMEEYATKLRGEGHKAYIIPAGGSSTLGAWGYIDGFDEMMKQGVLEDYDDIVVATGSVGTACALAAAKHLTGATIKIHAVATHNTKEFIYSHIDRQLQALGIRDAKARDLVDPIMDYVELGYGHSTEKELETIVDVMSQTGVSLDPEFCVKGVRGMVCEMEKNPGRFAGKRVLFIHSGGVFGLFDGRIDAVVEKSSVTNQILLEHEVFDNTS